MKKNLLLFLCASLLSGVNILFAQDPAQYGTPFTGVPDPRDVTIYQVNMRAFSSTHNLQGVTNRLDQIKALGTNVVYLMPVYPVGALKSVNSPYCIRNFDSVGTEFGTLTDLRNLVDGAHSRGMSVMLDWVVNQTSWDHPWITQHPDWYLKDGSGNIEALSPYTDVAALDFTQTAMRTAMITQMRYWVFAANVDGFRCDFADNPPIDFWQQTITSLRGITTHKLLLLAEGTRAANYTAGFDYNFGMEFYYNSLKPIFSGGAATDIDASNTAEYASATGTQQIVRYLTNHDVDGSDGAPVTLFGGKTGSMAAFVVAAYMKAVPFIYNGQEVAFPTPITFPFTTVTIDWTLNPDVTAEYTKVIAFRNSSLAIRRGTLVSYTNNDICAFTKTSGTQQVVVFSNLRNATTTYTLPAALANTTWKDAYSGATVTLGTSLSLTAYKYEVLTNANVPPVTGTTWYQITNRWQANTYLYDGGNGQVKYGTSPAGTDKTYQWAQVNAGNGYIQLQNRSTGNFMHVQDQNGAVESGAIQSSWYSAMWAVTATGDGWNYIQNRWQANQWIHIENLLGYAQYIGAQTGWYSAMWNFVNPVTAATITPSLLTAAAITPSLQTGTASGLNGAPQPGAIQLFPNPSAGGPFYISLPGLQAGEQASVTIRDSDGKLLYIKTIAGSAQLEQQLSAGLYFISVRSGRLNETKKLLVK